MGTEQLRIDDDGLALDPGRLSRIAITAVRLILAVAGLAAVLLGLLLLLVPDKTLRLAAVVLGIYFILVGGLRIGLGAFGRLHRSEHRVLGVIFGMLMLISGIIILRDSAAAAATLLIVVVLFTGIGWIVDGVLSIVESQNARSPGWAVAYGIICLLAGIVVLAVPGWSALWLVVYASVSLIILGAVGAVRGITFGRGRTRT